VRNYFLILLAIIFGLSACVPNRKLIYLQKKKGSETQKHKTDTVLRDYDLHDFDYRLQTNDIIYIKYQSLTEGEFDYSQQQAQSGGMSGGSGGSGLLMRGELVDNHGEIPMLVIGKVKVAGLTIFQAQDTLQRLANRFLDNTIIKVRLLNYRATILGEVNSEGTISFGENRVSLMEAIGLSGGLGELADRSNIKIIRQVNSEMKVFYVNVLEEAFLTSPFFYVHQNDIIIVPPLKQRTFKRYFTQNISVLLTGLSLWLLILTYTKK
jgi:polysaccharide biosynthesis/export protein